MQYETPPASWSSFTPGNINQDIYTIPIELGLIGALNYAYTPRSESLWPFAHETALSSSKSTTLPRSLLLPYAIGSTAGVFGFLSLANADFPFLTHTLGFTHAMLLTELGTSAAKTIFQRKRPSADTNVQNGIKSHDDNFSFYSGHASHAFSLATYSSALMLKYSPSTLLTWCYVPVAYGASSMIAISRVRDNAHHTLDVLMGAIVGTITASTVFYRVQNVSENLKTNSDSSKLTIQVIPSTYTDSSDKLWYTGTVNIQY